MSLLERPRRLRSSEKIRDFVREINLSIKDFVLPLFIKEGKNIDIPIKSMPGHNQISVDMLDKYLSEIDKLGLSNVILFGVPATKDSRGDISLASSGVIQEAIRYIKKYLPDIIVIADVCLCEYTDHGHCGILHGYRVDNDETNLQLAKQAVSYAEAGADIVAPSAMMDGMVANIRKELDNSAYHDTLIMSYAVKYASSMYGPFREAAEGAPKFGDRRTYQMDYANVAEAIKEARLDIAQGADILIVKPAHTYLDVIQKVKNELPGYPLAAYHTSGEFAMIKAAAEKGYLDENKAIIEVNTAIKRAGANIIISYYAREIAKIIKG
jgi:porphobilinogen synthase